MEFEKLKKVIADVLKAVDECFRYSGRRGKIHVGDPHRHQIVASIFLIKIGIFCRVGIVTVDYLVKIVYIHFQRYCFFVMRSS